MGSPGESSASLEEEALVAELRLGRPEAFELSFTVRQTDSKGRVASKTHTIRT